MNRALAVVAALASAVAFGLNAVASKVLYAPTSAAPFDPVALFVARGFWSLPFFLVLAIVTRPRSSLPITTKSVAMFALCGVLYGPGVIAFAAIGAYHTSGCHAVLLTSLFPPVAAVLAGILLRERLPTERIVAIAVGVIGAVVLAVSGSANGSSLYGDLFIGAFVLSWGILTVFIRVLERAYPPLFTVGVFGTIACVLLTAIGLAMGRLESVLIPLRHLDVETVVWFDLELVLLVSVGGWMCQALALRTLKVGAVAALTSYGAIFSGLFASVLILHEELTTGTVIAGLVLLTALALALVPESLISRNNRQRRSPTRSTT